MIRNRRPVPRLRAFAAAFLVVGVTAAHAASQAPVAARNGMVVTAQQLATHVGVDVLKDGGTAIDAAVAVGYAMAVVFLDVMPKNPSRKLLKRELRVAHVARYGG